MTILDFAALVLIALVFGWAIRWAEGEGRR